MAKSIRIMKRHVGRPLDFRGADGQVLNGHIVKVRNGIATILFGVPRKTEEFTTYLPVRDASIIEIY